MLYLCDCLEEVRIIYFVPSKSLNVSFSSRSPLLNQKTQYRLFCSVTPLFFQMASNSQCVDITNLIAALLPYPSETGPGRTSGYETNFGMWIVCGIMFFLKIWLLRFSVSVLNVIGRSCKQRIAFTDNLCLVGLYPTMARV